MSSSSKPIILYIGLDPNVLPVSALPIGKQVIAELGKAQTYAQEQGWDYEFWPHDQSDDAQLLFDKLNSKPYQIVIIGGGIKVMPQANEVFERVANAVKDLLPKARFVFVPGADDIVATVKRAGQIAQSNS